MKVQPEKPTVHVAVAAAELGYAFDGVRFSVKHPGGEGSWQFVLPGPTEDVILHGNAREWDDFLHQANRIIGPKIEASLTPATPGFDPPQTTPAGAAGEGDPRPEEGVSVEGESKPPPPAPSSPGEGMAGSTGPTIRLAFQPGQRVRCIDDFLCDLTAGRVYVVEEATPQAVKLLGSGGSYRARRFVLTDELEPTGAEGQADQEGDDQARTDELMCELLDRVCRLIDDIQDLIRRLFTPVVVAGVEVGRGGNEDAIKAALGGGS